MNEHMRIKLGSIGMGFGANTNNKGGMSVDVFFAGCSMEPKCRGCHNPELWDADGPDVIDMNLAQVKNYIQCTVIDGAVKNIVFMGGEPMDQQKATFLLAKWAKEFLGLKTWLYTGHKYKNLPLNIKGVMDVIVSGRYDETQKAEPGAFPASYNQEVHYGR